jgi:1-deoxy-D-xylulose-5-phosphate synthase
MLEQVTTPADLRALSLPQLESLAAEVRELIVTATSANTGHLGSNLGVVELTFALHRVFDSPKDILLWDTGHQAYVHKMVTGRSADFATLRQPGGLSGYPNQEESEHDWIENSHASTVLSYAHGIAEALKASGAHDRRVVAVIGDGSMTGGMAYEGLNNLGHSNSRVLIVLNDNGRSYAPTISRLTRTVSRIRSMPSYARGKRKSEQIIENLPLVGDLGRRTVKGVKAALREMVDEPTAFFETLGVRYVGPIDGHDLEQLEDTLRNAAGYEGAIVVHVLTQKGKGYRFAEDDDEKNLHDVPVFDPAIGPVAAKVAPSWTNAFTDALLTIAAEQKEIHAITAAMPGPTGLLPFQEKFPTRFHDVGIAEQHAVTLAAGMALGGLKPIVALYSTFLTRAFDQANLDVGLHNLPVVFALDRAGITGDDGPSHHGVLDMVLLSKVPGITMFAPSSAQELEVQLRTAFSITAGPSVIRYPKGVARQVDQSSVGQGLKARKVRGSGQTDICILAVGKLLEAAEKAAEIIREQSGLDVTIWDPRIIRPLDPAMIADAAKYRVVVTVEDGLREGGIGATMADAICEHRLATGLASGPVVILGTPIRFIPQGKPAAILSELGLDAPGIAATALHAIDSVNHGGIAGSLAVAVDKVPSTVGLEPALLETVPLETVAPAPTLG